MKRAAQQSFSFFLEENLKSMWPDGIFYTSIVKEFGHLPFSPFLPLSYQLPFLFSVHSPFLLIHTYILFPLHTSIHTLSINHPSILVSINPFIFSFFQPSFLSHPFLSPSLTSFLSCCLVALFPHPTTTSPGFMSFSLEPNQSQRRQRQHFKGFM